MIARKTIIIVIQNALGLFFGYLALKFIALELGSEELGVVAYGFSIIALFSFISNMGFQVAHVKRVSEGKDLGTCIGTFIAIKVAITALMAAAVITALTVWKFFYPDSLTNITEEILYVILLFFIFQSLSGIPINTFDARAETSKSQLPYILQHPFKLFAVLFVVFGAAEAARVSGGVEAHIPTAFRLSIAYYLIVGIVVFISSWAIFFFYRYPIKRPRWFMVRSYTKFALPAFLSSFIGTLAINTDKVMLGYFWGSADVGRYFGVETLSRMMLIIPTALAILLLPIMSNLDARKNRKAMRRILVTGERYTSMILVPIMFFIFFFSRPLIHLLLSDDWLEADFALSFLGIYAFVIAMNGPRGILLHAINRPGLTAKVAGARCILNVVLNLLFIPNWSWFNFSITIPGFIAPRGVDLIIHLYGLTGAAIATTLSSLLSFIALRYLTWRHVKAKLYNGFTIKHIIAASLMMTVLLILSFTVVIERWYHLIFFMLIGLGIYILVLYLIKEFKKKDLDFYIGLINPMAMKDYLKKEFKRKEITDSVDMLYREEE